jgi:hypothetical protein
MLYNYVFAPTIAHGITDLIDFPKRTLISYAIINPIVLNLNIEHQTCLLLASSVYHMRRDTIGGIVGSSIMHNAWLMYPPLSHFFIVFIHTPRHYLRTLKTKFIPKACLIVCMSFVAILGMKYNWNLYFENKYGPLWWSAPVISHIFVHELFTNFSRKM